MIRVAYMIDHLHVGGAQRHLLEVVRGLDRDRYALEMWTASPEPGDLGPVFDRLGVPVRSFDIRGTMLHPRTFAAIHRVARELRRRDVHVAHGYLFEGNFLAALVGRYGRLPVTLVSKRSLDRYTRVDRRLAAALSNVLADRVLVNATAVRRIVVEHEWCAERRIQMIPNGAALPLVAADEPTSVKAPDPRGSGPLVGMVGRLNWKKGYEYALDAAALLRDRLPGLRFDIVGDGSMRAELEERARGAGLADTVRFLGQRRDVPELMRGFDCFALSSIIEGMPNALLEAMALGRPVVTTSAGGSAEVVVDGESGFVVPPRDARALADAIERVLRDPALAARLGEAAARRVRENFSLEAMLSALDALYRGEVARAGIAVPDPAPHVEPTPEPRSAASRLT
jgi:glycosyltransferase involved in cell wall biosynthesis